MTTNKSIFDAFLDKYPQTSYGDVSANREMSWDQRSENALKVIKRGAMQSYIPDLLSDGAECDALVFEVIKGEACGSFVGAYSTNMGLLPETNKIQEERFACKCYILSAPTTIMISLKKCRQRDPLTIMTLPMFYGSNSEMKTPAVGDVLRVKYYERSWTAGTVLNTKKAGGKVLNLNDNMWLSPDNNAARNFNSQRSIPLSAYDSTYDFNEECSIVGQPTFQASGLRPSHSIIRKVLGWEGYRPYVYDMSRQGRGLWAPPTSGEWDTNSHKNHSGFISSFAEAQGATAIGVGHIIPEDQRTSFEAYLKGNTSVPQYVPGADKSGLSGGQAYDLLKEDMYAVADDIKANITVPLTQHQFDALCSLAFNIGAPKFNSSFVLTYLNEGACARAARAFLQYSHTTDPRLDRIVLRRRKAEARLFAGTTSVNLSTGADLSSFESGDQAVV